MNTGSFIQVRATDKRLSHRINRNHNLGLLGFSPFSKYAASLLIDIYYT